VPTSKNDMRLGDVVVSRPDGRYGGVVQYDFGKSLSVTVRISGTLVSGTLVSGTLVSGTLVSGTLVFGTLA
jgi:hypothetical protein